MWGVQLKVREILPCLFRVPFLGDIRDRVWVAEPAVLKSLAKCHMPEVRRAKGKRGAVVELFHSVGVERSPRKAGIRRQRWRPQRSRLLTRNLAPPSSVVAGARGDQTLYSAWGWRTRSKRNLVPASAPLWGKFQPDSPAAAVTKW